MSAAACLIDISDRKAMARESIVRRFIIVMGKLTGRLLSGIPLNSLYINRPFIVNERLERPGPAVRSARRTTQ
jgi:hypothetical protein